MLGREKITSLFISPEKVLRRKRGEKSKRNNKWMTLPEKYYSHKKKWTRMATTFSHYWFLCKERLFNHIIQFWVLLSLKCEQVHNLRWYIYLICIKIYSIFGASNPLPKIIINAATSHLQRNRWRRVQV